MRGTGAPVDDPRGRSWCSASTRPAQATTSCTTSWRRSPTMTGLPAIVRGPPDLPRLSRRLTPIAARSTTSRGWCSRPAVMLRRSVLSLARRSRRGQPPDPTGRTRENCSRRDRSPSPPRCGRAAKPIDYREPAGNSDSDRGGLGYPSVARMLRRQLRPRIIGWKRHLTRCRRRTVRRLTSSRFSVFPMLSISSAMF